MIGCGDDVPLMTAFCQVHLWPSAGIAILTFLSALEQVEADLWIQYAELGGATNQGLSTIDLELCPREFEGKRKLRRELGSMWYWRQRQAKSEKRV